MSEWVSVTLSVLGIILSAISITYIMYNLQEVFDKIKSLFKRKPKYKVGQKVRVRGDLIKHKEYGNKTMYRSMMQHVGSVVTIADIRIINKEVRYDIEEDWDDSWSTEMFESLKIKKEDAFEALLHGHIDDEEYKAIMNVGGVVKWYSRLVNRFESVKK